jgi:ankyrin repeat protein
MFMIIFIKMAGVLDETGSPIGDEIDEEVKEPTLDEIYKTFGYDFTALMFYVRKGNKKGVQREIQRHPPTINYENRHSESPLSMVAYTSPFRVDIAEILLDNGAEINTQNSGGWSPLMLACGRPIGEKEECQYDLEEQFSKKIAIVNLFLDRGADINHLGENHQTAIMVAAAEDESAELVKLLLSRGADINVQNRDGYTAIMEASYFGYTAVVEVFEKWPVTMAIILLQELRCYELLDDMSYLIDFIEFFGYEYDYIDY